MYEVSVSLVSCALKRTSEISNLEMAELSCIDVVKTARTRAPSRSLLESQAESPMRPIHERVSKPPLNHLYDIEVIEEERYKVKVHYIGYCSKYDEWIRKSEIAYKPTPTPAPQEDLSLLSALACSIKQKLVPSRKIEDPAVRIQLPFDSSTFQLMQQKGKPLGKSRGHTVVNYSDLNELLGERWHIRITNINGDFSYVILSTVRFYLTQPRPLLEFDVHEQDGDEPEFIPFHTVQPLAVVFQFVRGDGNRSKLSEFM